MNPWKISGMVSIVFMIIAMSCNKDPKLPNEEELITTLHLTLTPAGGGAPVVFSFSDPDGDGGAAPVVTSFPLLAGTVYTGTITMLNESVTPAVDISLEVQEESDEHQLFFIITDAAAVVQYLDEDDLGYPLGLSISLITVAASEGSIRIVLRHLPDKTAPGVSVGNMMNAGGETDIEVTFPLLIE